MKEIGQIFGRSFLLLTLATWSWLCISTIAKPIVAADSFFIQAYYGPTITDFVRVYQTGAMCLSDQREKVYDMEVQKQFSNKLISPHQVRDVIFINYVPFLFPLMAPLAILPIEKAYTIFYATTLLFGMGMLIFLNAKLKRFSALEMTIFVLAVFSSGSSVITLRIGQTSWLLLGFLCLFYYGLKWKREMLCGIAFSFLTLKFQYTPLFAVALLTLKRWRILLWAVVMEFILLSISGLSIGWHNVFNYPSILLDHDSSAIKYGPYGEHMICLRGILTLLLNAKIAGTISKFVLVAAAFGIFKFWQIVILKQLSLEWAFSVTSLTCFLYSPYCFTYDLVLLSLPALLTLPSLDVGRLMDLPNKSLKVWSLVLICYPVLTWLAFLFTQFWPLFVFNSILLVSSLNCAFASNRSDTKEIFDPGKKAQSES